MQLADMLPVMAETLATASAWVPGPQASGPALSWLGDVSDRNVWPGRQPDQACNPESASPVIHSAP